MYGSEQRMSWNKGDLRSNDKGVKLAAEPTGMSEAARMEQGLGSRGQKKGVYVLPVLSSKEPGGCPYHGTILIYCDVQEVIIPQFSHLYKVDDPPVHHLGNGGDSQQFLNFWCCMLDDGETPDLQLRQSIVYCEGMRAARNKAIVSVASMAGASPIVSDMCVKHVSSGTGM